MKKRSLFAVLFVFAAVLFIGGVYYVTLPPLSVYSGAFWTFFFLCLAVVLVSYYVVSLLVGKIGGETVYMPSGMIDFKATFYSGKKKPIFPKIIVGIFVLSIAFIIIGSLVGSTIFRAKTYSSLITLDEREFASDIDETEYVSDIALMDTDSARIIGSRTLGTLSDLVSQYEIADSYTQIAMTDAGADSAHPYKVAPLEYASFFKWLQNGKDGIPGYVKVDAVNFSAEFVRLEGEYIKYSPSSYFGKNLTRALRFAYPTAIFGSICFEVNDEGKPYWIASVMKPNAGLFGAMDVEAVVIMDAVTGECEKYAPAEAPEWVDIVYYGNLICQKYDWHGMLSGGFLNSQFSQRGCTVTTDDFGYKIIGNDVYVFTGVTSTSHDEANIGFILANSRTGEYRYYSVAGAEEYSAMAAAQGAVQQYRYTASFPSLVNVGGEATYIMVLKDASGIVKMYSMVNVTNYNIVVTSDTQEDVFRKYKAALANDNRGDFGEDDLVTEAVTVEKIIYVTTDGDSVVYFKTNAGVFKTSFDERVLFIGEGDTITVFYLHKEDGKVCEISKFE